MELVKLRGLQIKVAAFIIFGKSQLTSLFLRRGLSRQTNLADVRLQQMRTVSAAFTAPVCLPDILRRCTVYGLDTVLPNYSWKNFNLHPVSQHRILREKRVTQLVTKSPFF